MTTTKIINRSDWTGRTVEITIDGDTFIVGNLGRFALELVPMPEDLEDLCGPMWKIRSADGQWAPEHSLGTVYGYKDGQCEAMGAVTRDAGCPFEAAAQLLCNTI